MEYKVKKYKEMILDENKRQNLVSRRSPENEIEKHIFDSLAMLDYFSLSKLRLIDIGSGAGFPGMVLAIMVPDCRISLVESDKKKGAFLKNVIETLEIDNVDVIINRIEEIGQELGHRESYDLCTSRAVAHMRILLEYGLPFLKIGGLTVMWKGRNYEQEISESEHALQAIGGKVKSIFNYNLMDEFDRTLVVVEKVLATSSQFPRRVGIPAKRPL